jgi:surface protein
MNGMFSGCSSLKTIPQLDTSSVTDLYEIFYDCISLETVPQLNTSSATVLTGAFTSCPALQTAALAGTSVAVSYRYCLLGRSAIVSIFNGLANASATIDVRNNYGVSTLTSGDRAIATGKGWTVLS